MKKVKFSLGLLSILTFALSCSSNSYIQNDQLATIQTVNDNSSDPADKIVSMPKTTKTPKSQYQDLLISWDKDKTDKGLTFQEIKAVVDNNSDGNLTFEELINSGLDKENAQLILDRTKSNKKNDSLVYKLVELDSKVFPGGISKISEHDIQQGKRNVCYFISGLASIAYHRRGNDILNLIEKNRDNTYTVTFPGVSKNNKFTVGFPTEEDLKTLIYRGENGSAWVAIMVNAYHKYGESGGRPFKHTFAKKYVSDYGLTWEGIETQTGHVAESYLLDFYNTAKLMDKLHKALDQKKAVTIDTFLKGNIASPIDPKKGELKFSKAHILSVIDIDDKKETLTIRDPYGEFEYYDEKGIVHVDKSTDGVMYIPVSNLKKYFLDISIESNDKGTFKGTRNIFKRFF